MKRILFIFFFYSLFAQAQTITQSLSHEITFGLYCSNYITTYVRYFELESDHDISYDYHITEVKAGIYNVNGGAGSINLQLYSTQTDNFPTGFVDEPSNCYNLLFEEVYSLPNQNYYGNPDPFAYFPVEATVPAGYDLVVKFSYQSAWNNKVLLGMNQYGETKPSYFSCVDELYELSTTMYPYCIVMDVTGVNAELNLNSNYLEKINIYPNPVKNIVYLNIPSGIHLNNVNLQDMSGKSFEIILNKENTIDIASLDSGMYILNLETSAGLFRKKIIKE